MLNIFYGNNLVTEDRPRQRKIRSLSTGQQPTSSTLREIQLLVEQIKKAAPSHNTQVTASCSTPVSLTETNISTTSSMQQIHELATTLSHNYQAIASCSTPMSLRETNESTAPIGVLQIPEGLTATPSNNSQRINPTPGTSSGGYTPYGAQLLTRQNATTNSQIDTPRQSISELFRQKRNHDENSSHVETKVLPVETEDTQPAKKPRYGNRFNWPALPEMVFESYDECFQFIQSENTWTGVRDRTTKHGMRGEYRCNGVKARGKDCSAGICTRFGQTPGVEKYELYRLEAAHDHLDSSNKVTKLSDEGSEGHHFQINR